MKHQQENINEKRILTTVDNDTHILARTSGARNTGREAERLWIIGVGRGDRGGLAPPGF